MFVGKIGFVACICIYYSFFTARTLYKFTRRSFRGKKGIVSTNVSDKSNLTYKHGFDGSNADEIEVTEDNPYGGSYGGTGGTSGLDIKGGCGGMFVDSAICTNTTVNGTYVSFVSPGDVFEAAEYGSAGAGGGGGAWSDNVTFYPNPGSGAQGQNGYVYLYWVEY